MASAASPAEFLNPPHTDVFVVEAAVDVALGFGGRPVADVSDAVTGKRGMLILSQHRANQVY